MVKLSEAVEDSTRFVAAGTGIATIVMVVIFFILHLFVDFVPFGAGVIVAAALGWAVSTGNFFMMAIAAEKAASEENYDNAKRRMTLSYRYRTLMQLVFIVVVLVVPFLNPVSGIIPLFLPSFLIRGKGIVDVKRNINSTPAKKQDGDENAAQAEEDAFTASQEALPEDAAGISSAQ